MAFDGIVREIEKAQMKEIKKEKFRNYIGGSILGSECDRKIQYNLTHPHLRILPEPGKQRIFDMGNIIESYLGKLLRIARFDLITEKSDGEQYSFKMANGKIQGHVDGILRGGPKIMSYPALVEFKSAKHSSFQKFKKNGVASENQQYFAQVQMYQKCMNITNDALWMVMNKDNSEIYAELIPHHPSFAESLIDKADRILQATDNDMLCDRGYLDKNNWHCKFCDFREECWKEMESGPEWDV